MVFELDWRDVNLILNQTLLLRERVKVTREALQHGDEQYTISAEGKTGDKLRNCPSGSQAVPCS